MADKVELELVSPERLLSREAVDMVVVPGAEGDFGVLPRHAPLISTLRPGVLRIYDGRSERERIFVSGGFAEVTPERCTVLAEQAVPVREIDRASLEAELKELAERLGEAQSDEERGLIARRIQIREAMRAVAP
jgi:F-type H+-transporting ATPase subunit epsilon